MYCNCIIDESNIAAESKLKVAWKCDLNKLCNF